MGEHETQIVQRLVSKMREHHYKDGEWLVLWKMSTQEFADPLAEYLDDVDEWVSDQIAMQLAKSGDRRATARIVKMIDRASDNGRDPNAVGVDHIRRMLGKIDSALEIEVLLNGLHAAKQISGDEIVFRLGYAHARNAVEPLIAELNNDKPTVRWAVVKALGEIGDERAIVPLANMLNDEMPQVVHASVVALAKFGPQSVEHIIRALSRKDEGNLIVYAAVFALGEIADARAVASLLPMLNYHNADFRLPELDSKQRWPKSIWRKEVYTDAEIRTATAMTLGKIGDKQAIDSRIPLVTDADLKIRLSALSAMVALGAAKLSQLTDWLDHPDEETQLMAIRMLDELNDQRAFKPIMDLLRDNRLHRNVKSWEVATTVLVRWDYKQTILTLIEILEDRRVDQRGTTLGFYAGWVLPHILASRKDSRDDEDIRHALNDVIAHGDRQSRYYAREAFLWWGYRNSLDIFVPALKEEDSRLREQALEALGRAGSDVTAPLLDLLESEQRPYLRARAVRILKDNGDERAIPKLEWIAANEKGPQVTLEMDTVTIQAEAAKAIRYIKTRNYILTGKEL